MSRLTGPLFSLAASGTIAKTLTYSRWKGIPYVRTRVIPYNPKETKQLEVRGIFSTLTEMYKRMPQLARDPWQAAVKGQPLTDRNLHIQKNLAALIDETTLVKLLMSVAMGQAIPPVSATFTPLLATITCLGVEDTLPVGYTLTSMTAAICLTGDPSPVFITTTLADEVAESPYSIEFTDLETDTYQCGMWCKYERTKDLKVFYSAAITGEAIVPGE